RASAHRGRRAGQPCPPRPGRRRSRRRADLPLALVELVARRPDAEGRCANDDRRRPHGLRGMTVVVDVPVELARYLDELVRRLSAVVGLDAVYLFGSAAQGSYEHGRSDVDVIAVTARPSSQAEKEAIAEAAESLPCRARKLELVVYARGAERHEL